MLKTRFFKDREKNGENGLESEGGLENEGREAGGLTHEAGAFQ